LAGNKGQLLEPPAVPIVTTPIGLIPRFDSTWLSMHVLDAPVSISAKPGAGAGIGLFCELSKLMSGWGRFTSTCNIGPVLARAAGLYAACSGPL